MMKIPVFFLIAVLAIVAGCSSNAGPSPSPTGGIACPALALVPPQLAYPIPGATGVPVAAGSLVFYGSIPSNYAGTLTSTTSASIALGAFGAAPSPLPSPLASPNAGPGGSAPAVAGVPYPQLAAATTYTISFSDTGPCAMRVTDASYAFTTH
jgi:hypothetical protein